MPEAQTQRPLSRSIAMALAIAVCFGVSVQTQALTLMALVVNDGKGEVPGVGTSMHEFGMGMITVGLGLWAILYAVSLFFPTAKLVRARWRAVAAVSTLTGAAITPLFWIFLLDLPRTAFAAFGIFGAIGGLGAGSIFLLLVREPGVDRGHASE